jgi:hypothetical protein
MVQGYAEITMKEDYWSIKAALLKRKLIFFKIKTMG